MNWSKSRSKSLKRAIRFVLFNEDSRAHRRLCSWLRRGLMFAVFLGLILMSPGAQQFVVAQAQPQTLDVAQAQLDRFMELIEQLRNQIDRTQFDVDALSFELALGEPATIVAWVRENIAFEQYPGLLRGAQGTLMSRAGNALDQAVLLATLLGDAGFEVRIGRAPLTNDQADRLIGSIGIAEPPPQAFGNVEAMKEILAELATHMGQDPVEVITEFEEVLESDLSELGQVKRISEVEASHVISLLGEAGLALSDSGEDILEEARDYFWVEYRLFEGESWQAAHPTIAESHTDVFRDVLAMEYITAAIPASLQHRIVFEVINEQLLGDRLISTPVMKAWERPVANMIGVPISYANIPDGVNTFESMQDLRAALQETDFFFPYFNGRIPEGGQAFDLAGNLIPPEVAQTAQAGVFKEVSDSFNRATDALNDLGNADADADSVAAALVAQYLRYTLIRPGGDEVTFERTVFDHLVAEGRENREFRIRSEVDGLDAATSLVHEVTFMVAGGELPIGFILDKMLEETLAARPVIANLMKGSPSENDLWDDLDSEASPLLHLNLLAGFDNAALVDAENTYYRSGPTVLSVEAGLFGDADQLAGQIEVDIVANPRRVFDRRAGVFRPDLVVRSGVWETYSEQLDFGDAEVRSSSAFEELRNVREAGTDFLVITANSRDGLDAMHLSSQQMALLESDLTHGFAVVIPEMPAGDRSDLSSWWRVDTKTGHTVGMSSSGRGGETIDLLILLGFVFVLVFAVCSLVLYVINISINNLWDANLADVDPDDVMTPRQIGFCAVAGIMGVFAFLAAAIYSTWVPIILFLIGFVLGLLNTGFMPPSWSSIDRRDRWIIGGRVDITLAGRRKMVGHQFAGWLNS